jgi:DNA-binding GntR family transcriptional regulator
MERLAQTASVNARVLSSLRAAVITGELVPGSLYSVQTLADQLGVSRTPVREALIKLAQQGMVRFERNRGVRVLLTSLHDLEEVFALRLLLEPPAVQRAVTRLDAAHRRQLRRMFVQMEKAAKADDEFTMLEHDRRFHRALLEVAGNTRLASFVDGLRDMVLRRGVSTARESRSLDDIVAEHREILELAEAGDAEGAAEAMRVHIRHTAELLIAQEAGGDGALVVDLSWTGGITTGR